MHASSESECASQKAARSRLRAVHELNVIDDEAGRHDGAELVVADVSLPASEADLSYIGHVFVAATAHKASTTVNIAIVNNVSTSTTTQTPSHWNSKKKDTAEFKQDRRKVAQRHR